MKAAGLLLRQSHIAMIGRRCCVRIGGDEKVCKINIRWQWWWKPPTTIKGITVVKGMSSGATLIGPIRIALVVGGIR